jgi:mRNA interferase RelE/StbE
MRLAWTFEYRPGALKALTGPLKSYWSYCVGDNRILCGFHDQRLVVLVLKIGDRKDVYR